MNSVPQLIIESKGFQSYQEPFRTRTDSETGSQQMTSHGDNIIATINIPCDGRVNVMEGGETNSTSTPSPMATSPGIAPPTGIVAASRSSHQKTKNKMPQTSSWNSATG